ncbi:hypothetical protein DL764_004844 [Monosporascus ibericus]|uniref:Protein arginine methyltransferase NDUFAF7 n=1 Tax=Monosporascus ibericus TaxID=155417 RepID=A0A4Q4TB69_9PEZI|nr:hypothetical protein DL764_004844 [Monosporascus ibericus]
MRRAVLRIARTGFSNYPTRCRTAFSRSSFTIVSQSSRCLSATAARRDEEREWTTPLAKQLTEAINADIGGYYTGAIEKDRDQFGQKGDFITSPEISQVFGELIGICIDAVYMVEASKELRATQKNLLCDKDASMRESKVGWHSTCKYTHTPIVWTETINAVPQSASKTPFIVAHEFFDALPIHAFQVVEVPPTQQPTTTSGSPRSASSKTTSPTLQWREMVVSPTPAGATHAELGTPKSEQHGPVPEFQMTLSRTATRHALYVPESSPRYRALKSTPGALIEVCPDAALYASDFAARIGGTREHPKRRPSGAALVLDYGPADTIPANSLRGIWRHRRVSPFAKPGLVDLSADVDFTALAEAATRASEGVEVHGPVEQAPFLEAMGVRQRAEALARSAGDPDRARAIERAWRRLVDRGPDGMGKVYKALAILPENGGKRRPVGFGGDVAA